MTLYFAYGDLLDSGVLRGRLGIPAGGNMPTPIAPAKLTQHKLLFRRLIAADARTFPDVAPDPSATIYGALLDLTDAQVAVLEAAPAPNMYRRLQSDVTPYLPQRGPVQVGGVVVRHEQKVTAILHEAVNKTADVAQPTRQQMRAILDGALASELPLLWSRSLIGSFGQLSCVDDISTEKCDGAGEPITKVYTKAASLYAVYETDRVKVQYADDMERADQQRKNMAELNELRGQIAGLIDGWQTAKRRRSPLPAWLRTGDAENHDAKPDPRVKKYNSRVAAGLIMCLEGDAKGARSTLQGVYNDILADRESLGRYQYLNGAFWTCVLIVVLFYLFRHTHWNQFYKFPGDTTQLMLAARAGAVGAFFSVAMGLTGRTIKTDLHPRDNLRDAVLRIMIGTIAGGVLVLLLQSKFIATLAAGSGHIELIDDWKAILVVGFVAGFLERLVPDLLEKSK